MAASTNNRLDRIVSGFNEVLVDVMDKSYNDATTKLETTRTKVNEATKNYGADVTEIITAQSAFTNAEICLKDASKIISEAKATTDVTEFLKKSANAFEKIDEFNAKVKNVEDNIESASKNRLTTIVGAAASVLVVGGGGFLYYRKKKRSNEEKVEKVREEKPEKPSKKFCKKCGKEIDPNANFCDGCGTKVK